MAKINNLPAAAYAKPHTMSGKTVTAKSVAAGESDNKKYLREMNVSVANSRSNDYPPTKTDGIKIRGTGAATRGITARGPMA